METIVEQPTEPTTFGSNRFSVIRDSRPKYHWKRFAPTSDGACSFFSWLVRGFSPQAELSDEEVHERFCKLARTLMLLREYETRFGMPEVGGPRDQQWVLKELCKQLYSSGTPIWVLQAVMERAAEGLTGALGVVFFLLPRTAFVFAPSSGDTDMFRYERGFHIHKVTIMERILVRLASFGTNTEAVNSVKCTFPDPDTFKKIGLVRGESIRTPKQKEELAKAILDLASEGAGLFFFTHAKENLSVHHKNVHGLDMDPFWEVEPSIKELFTRLAAIEAENSIDAGVEQVKQYDSKYYPMPAIVLFRMFNSFLATGLWFKGSWYDMTVAGMLACFVALAQGASIWKHDRVIFEAIVSFVVGLCAGLISLSWYDNTCFGAIAVGSVIDILQGFKIVFSITELMSKHTLTGGADFMESFLFTGLIASFLKLGQSLAWTVLKKTESQMEASTQCDNPIAEQWYILILPLASTAWAYLFQPRLRDMAGMAFHGILGYSVYYVVEKFANSEGLLGTFVGALSVTLSAGIVSRFTGRQALGDTVTGLYVLVPGAYLTRGLFEAASTNAISSSLLYSIIVNSVVIGLGAWSGTILCSPTILGTNRGLMNYSKSLRTKDSRNYQRGRHSERKSPMLFF